eukprot:4160969-Amphidinium_carterae.2
MSYSIPGPEGTIIRAYSDSDWAGCQTTKKSTTGTVVTCGTIFRSYDIYFQQDATDNCTIKCTSRTAACEMLGYATWSFEERSTWTYDTYMLSNYIKKELCNFTTLEQLTIQQT